MQSRLYRVAGLVCLLLLAGSRAVQAISLGFAPASQSVAPGTSVAVDLVISDLGDSVLPSLSTFDLDIFFNPAILALDPTDADGDGVIDSVILDPTGQLDVLGLGGNVVSAGLTGSGILNLFDLSADDPNDLHNLQAGTFLLAMITFETLRPGTSTLTLTVNALGDAEGNPLTATVGSGSITVRPLTGVPEPGISVLLGTGLLGLLGYCWRHKRLQKAGASC
jgi:hypothetical protein